VSRAAAGWRNAGRGAAPIAVVLAALGAWGCAHAPRSAAHPHAYVEIAPDSVTLGLWRMDETGGTRAADSGPLRLDGRAGIDTRTDFGRVRGARLFTRSTDSFVYVPYSPLLESPDALTVEAWVYLNAYGQYEDTPIAARWTEQPNEESWMLSVLGLDIRPPYAALPGPGYHEDLVAHGVRIEGPTQATRGELMFVFQPEAASGARAYFSTRRLELERWTHVAVSYDGAVVRLWVDGDLDAQFAAPGRIRRSRAGLVIGNYLDPRWLSDFSGDLRITSAPDANPYYAFDGFLDELRISSVVREDFGYARGGGR
jgi:hypothetical protein